MNSDEFEALWHGPLGELARLRAAIDPGPRSTQLDSIIAARAAMEASATGVMTAELASSTRTLARWTRWMALATFLVVLVSAGATVLANLAAREGSEREERMACFAEVQARATAGSITAVSVGDMAGAERFAQELATALLDEVEDC